MKVELIFDDDCPNISAARTQLMKAFSQADQAPQWTEWSRQNEESPAYVMKYGSPTILVNGVDVDHASGESSGNSCRLYRDPDGTLAGVPSMNRIVSAIRCASDGPRPKKGRLSRLLALLPLIFTILLPKLTCPACWPAYAGILSALGVGFINYTPYLFPLMLVFTGTTLLSLAWKASNRRGYRPLVIGCIAAAFIIASKIFTDNPYLLYGGLIMLIGASIWNVWPQKMTQHCPQCVDQQKEVSS